MRLKKVYQLGIGDRCHVDVIEDEKLSLIIESKISFKTIHKKISKISKSKKKVLKYQLGIYSCHY